MAKSGLKTASVLAFERKIANSDALMFAGMWDKRDGHEAWVPIVVKSKDLRGTISNRLKNAIADDAAKLDAEIQKANLQNVDVASLPVGADTLKTTFTLKVLSGVATPSACNSQDYQKALAQKINGYVEAHKFTELAARYAENIANGRFLWRNRIGAEAVEVRVNHVKNGKTLQKWVFNSHDFDLHGFSKPNESLRSLAEIVRLGLMGDDFVFLEVSGFARLGAGQEVYPSQELVLDSGNSKGKKSKYLYQVDGVAAMHSQKIGNALRTIDTWYPEASDFGPIAVEPYGSVTSRGTAFRQPKEKVDFYTLLDDWILKDKAPPTEQQHYVIATLIRGGVFGEKAD